MKFSTSLLTWYQKNKRDLPWRRTKDPYKIWISEMMLQQTTVSTVIPYYEAWFNRFPTVHDLAKAKEEIVLKAWQGLGYYARARNLHKTAQIIHAEYKGVIPKDPQLVRAFPGFGPYSTGSVLSIAYDLPLTIIDANVRRVIMRILALEGVADTKQDKDIEAFLREVFPSKNAGDFNQALMELGALVCKAKDPLCDICPVAFLCRARQENRQNDIPTLKKKTIQEIKAVIAVISNGNKFFIQKRPAKGLMANMWEFPGGKIEKGESKEDALKREIQEELGVDVIKAKYLFEVFHFYTQFKVKLSVFSCELLSYPNLNPMRRWVSLDSLGNYPMPSGTVKIIERLVSCKS